MTDPVSSSATPPTPARTSWSINGWVALEFVVFIVFVAYIVAPLLAGPFAWIDRAMDGLLS